MFVCLQTVVDMEVKVLLDLKTQLKELTGEVNLCGPPCVSVWGR